MLAVFRIDRSGDRGHRTATDRSADGQRFVLPASHIAFFGLEMPDGYVEPVLHRYRREVNVAFAKTKP